MFWAWVPSYDGQTACLLPDRSPCLGGPLDGNQAAFSGKIGSLGGRMFFGKCRQWQGNGDGPIARVCL
jgi:hypothetical protein